MNKILMKIIITIFMISTIIAEARVVAAISSMKGNVLIRSASNRKFDSAYKGQMIRTGDWIKTDVDVFVAIVFLDGSNVKIQAKTEIEIKSSRITAKELKTQMYIAEGEAWSKVSNQKNGEFKIKTPTAVATVKGTEFNVEFDDFSGETTLIVLEGEVLFGNDIYEVLAGAMEGATASKNEAPEKYKVDPKDVPTWQNNTDPSWGFKLTPDRTGKHPVNQPMKVSILIINTKTKDIDNEFNNEVQITSDSELLFLSTDGSTWSNTVNVTLKGGRGTVHIKGSHEGNSSIIVSANDSESKKLGFEFYISKSQKRSLDGKLSRIAEKKGLTDVSLFITGRSLKSTVVISGEANIDELLQKVDTGEYEIMDIIKIENPDGTISVKLIVKPRSQGGGQ